MSFLWFLLGLVCGGVGVLLIIGALVVGLGIGPESKETKGKK